MLEVLLLISILGLVLITVLLFRIWKLTNVAALISKMEETSSALRQEISGTLQKTSMDLTEHIVKANSETRQEVSDRLAQGFRDVQEMVVKQLSEGRGEQSKSLADATSLLTANLKQAIQNLQQRFAELDTKTQQSLEAIRSKVDERLLKIGEQVQTKLDENIKEGFKHFEKVQEHLKAAEMQLQGLSVVGNSINELNNLLKLPHLRGGFGESTLERLLSDFLPNELYELQAPISKNSQERVDALIKLPKANLPIDSKFPREQVLPLFETSDASSLAEARKVLSQTIRTQAKSISSKYIRPADGTTDLALMFLPSETLYFEVLRDGDLWEFLKKEKVLPISPNTLSVTLYGISMSFDYYEMARNVEKTIEEIKKAQKHFGHFESKFEEVGKGLDKAQSAFHTASTHLGRYSSSVVRLTGEQPEEIEETKDKMLPLDENREGS